MPRSTKPWRALVIVLMFRSYGSTDRSESKANMIEFSALVAYVALTSAALFEDELVPAGSVSSAPTHELVRAMQAVSCPRNLNL